MKDCGVNWETVILALITALPGLLVAVGTLIVTLRTKSKVGEIHEATVEDVPK